MHSLSLSKPSHWIRLVVVVAAFFMALVGLANDAKDSGQEKSVPSTQSRSEESATDEDSAFTSIFNGETRLREGSQIENELGLFHDTGDRIIFQPRDTDLEFQALENLALERVSRVLDETPTPRLWSVSGMVTEFKGGNYLLVKRAVLKSKGAVSDRRTADRGR